MTNSTEEGLPRASSSRTRTRRFDKLRRLPLRRRLGEHAAAYLLLAPALTLLAVWFLYPIASSFVLSFQAVNIFRFSEREFVGATNYRELLTDPVFHNAIRITLTFVLLVAPTQTVLALLAAAVVNTTGAAKVFFRTAFFVPYVTSTVAVTTVFMHLFTAGRPIPRFLSGLLGLPDVSWYANVNLALLFLAIIYVWMNLGLYMVIFLSGLQTVPAMLYEAAVVDGANPLQSFWYITVPSLRPFTFFVLVSGMIQAFQVFDQVYVISGGSVLGGPAGATTTLVVFIFAEAFRYNKLGYASAAAVVLLGIVLTATLVVRRVFREETDGSES
jgi:multiple sugar transport system permease protein